MEMVLGLSRSEIDIEEIRKRICYILLAALLIMSLAFTAESFENVVAVETKDSWSVRERTDVLPDVAGNSLAIEDVLAAVNLAKALNLPEENLLVEAEPMTAEPAVTPAPAKTSSAEAIPAVTASTTTAPTVTTPAAVVPDVITPTEDITTPSVTDTPGTTDTPGAAVIPETLTIHLNGNRRRTGAFHYDRIHGCGFRQRDGVCRSGLARCLTAGIWTRDALFHLQE